MRKHSVSISVGYSPIISVNFNIRSFLDFMFLAAISICFKKNFYSKNLLLIKSIGLHSLRYCTFAEMNSDHLMGYFFYSFLNKKFNLYFIQLLYTKLVKQFINLNKLPT